MLRCLSLCAARSDLSASRAVEGESTHAAPIRKGGVSLCGRRFLIGFGSFSVLELECWGFALPRPRLRVARWLGVRYCEERF